MKSWKRTEEKKEENAWAQAIVSQEEKIENGEEVGDVCTDVSTDVCTCEHGTHAESLRMQHIDSHRQCARPRPILRSERRARTRVRWVLSFRMHAHEQDEDVSMIEAEEALKQGAAAKAPEPPPEDEEDEEDEDMSTYERERLANIKRNNAFLLNLGIDTIQAPVTPKPRPAPKARKHDKSPSVTPGSAVPTRRSTRAAAGEVELKSKKQELQSLEEQLQQWQETGDSQGGTEEYLTEQIALVKTDIARIEEENAAKRARLVEDSSRARAGSWAEEEEEVELNYDDSSVKRYECESVRLRVPQTDLTKGVQGIAPIEGATYHDNNLKRIYSISFRPCGKLVAAAGHGGIAGIFGIGSSAGGSDAEDVLLSWKAHQGWIGDIQFVSQQQAESASNLVLSTSNDKTVVLWDINTAASAGRQVVPKKVATETWHSSGVFSMHELGGRIATGSKDGNVVVAQFKDGKIRKSAVLEDVLEGHVVKCVRLRPNLSVEAASAASSVLACGGNSHTVRVLDVREGQASKGGSTLEAANSAVSFVQWSPADQHVLMSCRYGSKQQPTGCACQRAVRALRSVCG